MAGLRGLISGDEAIVAPFVFDGLSARLAVEAGFKALYLGGGSLGFQKAVSEANLTLHDLVGAGLDIATVCEAPLIMDGAGGWGDPMHLHRTLALAERAGFGAIEIEDQVLPKRAHHHVGVEHLIPADLMAAKIAEAAAARRDPDFVIIARTNAGRHDMDEALRRAAAYVEAGADMILSFPAGPEEMRLLGQRLDVPLMAFIPPGKSTNGLGISMQELAGLGFRLLADPTNALIAVAAALRRHYATAARGVADAPGEAEAEYQAILRTVGLERLLQIERRTVET